MQKNDRRAIGGARFGISDIEGGRRGSASERLNEVWSGLDRGQSARFILLDCAFAERPGRALRPPGPGRCAQKAAAMRIDVGH